MIKRISNEKILLGFVDEVIKRDVILKKIDMDELKIFVDSDGRIATNIFKQNMKELWESIDDIIIRPKGMFVKVPIT